ncbi:MAG: hypothetical protein C0631_17400 [Sedimenticola sp.]|jgi:hypothetical protein|nr:MAG: hypothetical protein C0631_17400 [Sedimenticola sp.]
MDRKTVFGLTSLILIMLAFAILIPGGKAPDTNPKLPWDIRVTSSGAVEVFGLILGKSTLSDVQAMLRERGKTSLFVSPENNHYIESYFESMTLSGIKASFVITLNVDQPLAQEMFKRGLRMKSLATGNKQVSLTSEDIDNLGSATIDHITYIPVANLDEAMIQGRFGEPKFKLPDEEAGVMHWLYPDKGLDIAIHTEGKEVIQYIRPSDFGRILEPLRAMQQAVNTENGVNQ